MLDTSKSKETKIQRKKFNFLENTIKKKKGKWFNQVFLKPCCYQGFQNTAEYFKTLFFNMNMYLFIRVSFDEL